MSRRNTKADRILNDSAMRLEAAVLRENLAQSQLNTARALREYAEDAHRALVSELAPTPRKTGKKPAAGPVAPKEQANPEKVAPGLCSHVFEGGKPCLAAPSNAIHDPEFEYAGHHSFKPSNFVARAPRKSRVKSEATNSIPSIGGEMESVTHTSNAGD